MFEKKTKSYTEFLGKTNRIVEGTIIKGDIISQADFRLDGELTGNFQTKGKIVIGPAGSVTGDIICKNADIEGKYKNKIQVLINSYKHQINPNKIKFFGEKIKFINGISISKNGLSPSNQLSNEIRKLKKLNDRQGINTLNGKLAYINYIKSINSL